MSECAALLAEALALIDRTGVGNPIPHHPKFIAEKRQALRLPA